MNHRTQNQPLLLPLGVRPAARAEIRGGAETPVLHGRADFYAHMTGALVAVELWGLPYDPTPCAENIYALHIHAGGSCTDGGGMAFSGAGGHYNPKNCPHPAHAGDLPPLFGNRGYAWQAFYTARFSVREIIGKTVIVHSRRDDFTSQPAGDAGGRIGCGVIRRLR